MALSREALEGLAALSTDELREYVQMNPQLAAQIAAADPRAKLMEEFYADPEARKDMQRHGKRLHPKATVLEVDIPDEITKTMKPHLDKIAALEKELGDLKTGDKRKVFLTSLRDAGAADADLDAIEQFMVDNEFGPKAVTAAVEAFYKTKEAAEPNYEKEGVFSMPDGGGAEHLKALMDAGPGDDLDLINQPFVEKIVREEFGKGAPQRPTRPAMA